MTPNTTSDSEYPKVMGRRKDGRNLIEVRKGGIQNVWQNDNV